MSEQPEILHHFYGGQRVVGQSNRYGDVFNPATGTLSAQVPFATAGEVRAAVESAMEALPEWASTPSRGSKLMSTRT